MSDLKVRPGSVAPLKNVAACVTLVETLRCAPAHHPRIGVFSGYSGYGKSMAAQYCWNSTGAVFLEVFEYWSRSTFCRSLLAELGVARPRGTIADMMDEAIALLGDAPARPIIIDEADKLAAKGMLGLVRDLHDAAQVPVLLVGEELLPKKLEADERLHNRVLDWALAQPCDLEDARALAAFLHPGLSISDGLLERIRSETKGRARRIATSLHEAAAWAAARGRDRLDETGYGGRIFDGSAPSRHAARAG